MLFDAKIMHVKQFLKICKIEPFGEGGGTSPHFGSSFPKMCRTKKTLKMDYLALEYVHTIDIPL